MTHPTPTQQSSSTTNQALQGVSPSTQGGDKDTATENTQDNLESNVSQASASSELSVNSTKDNSSLMSLNERIKVVFMLLLAGMLLLIPTPLGLFVMIFITLPSWMLKLETKTDIMMTSPATGIGWLLGIGLLAFALGLISWFLAAIWHGLKEAKLQEQQRVRLKNKC